VAGKLAQKGEMQLILNSVFFQFLANGELNLEESKLESKS